VLQTLFKRRWQDIWENYIPSSFVICAHHFISLGCLNPEVWDGRGM
jgi:hypothetical protein